MKTHRIAYRAALIAAAALVGEASAGLPTHTIGFQGRPPQVIDCTRPDAHCIAPPPPPVDTKPHSVPEPAGLLVLATGVAALLVRNRKPRK